MCIREDKQIAVQCVEKQERWRKTLSLSSLAAFMSLFSNAGNYQCCSWCRGGWCFTEGMWKQWKRNEGGMKCTVQDDIDVWPSAPFVGVGLVRILIRLQIDIIIITFYPYWAKTLNKSHHHFCLVLHLTSIHRRLKISIAGSIKIFLINHKLK